MSRTAAGSTPDRIIINVDVEEGLLHAFKGSVEFEVRGVRGSRGQLSAGDERRGQLHLPSPTAPCKQCAIDAARDGFDEVTAKVEERDRLRSRGSHLAGQSIL
jgi:hypothetical protein